MEGQKKNTLNIHGFACHFERPEDFDNSFYRNVYREAYMNVEDIIRQSNMVSGYPGGNSRKNNYYMPLSSLPELPNIITFVGSRGAGKSSVMRSFTESLKDYYRDKKANAGNAPFYTFSEKENILFTCLDCIDGSLMEHGEDIFKTILAQMYQKFTDLESNGEIRKGDDFDFQKRELLKGLEDIYRTVCDIETMEKGHTMSGEAYMNSLQSFSSSQKVRKEFVRLISKFTTLMKYKRHGWIEKSDDHFVVISIDDIDLNINSSFSMLEKINRYCTVPNVIVLLTLDIQQMLAIATRYYYKVVPKADKLLSEQEEDIRRLSVNYLEKVLPISYRIYMPSLNTRDSLNAVVLEKEAESVKKSILGKLYRRTGICFDSQGLKKHFYEPDSMRQLTGIYMLLDSMDKLDKSFLSGAGDELESEEAIEKFKTTFAENYYVLASDVENRMAFEKLNRRSEIKVFQKLAEEDARRAMASAVNFYRDCREKVQQEEAQEKGRRFIKPVSNVSYGELVEAVYDLGRIDNGSYKMMVHCLIAYFSYEFAKKYTLERLEVWEAGRTENKNSPGRQAGAIEQLVNGCVAHDWTNDYLPPVLVGDIANVGTTESSGGSEPKLEKRVGRVERVNLPKVFVFPLQIEDEQRKTDYEKVARIIREVELQCLFFSNITASRTFDEGCPWRFCITDNMSGKRVLAYDNKWREEIQSVTGEFSFLNIINNSMYGSKKLACIEEAIRRDVGINLGICDEDGSFKNEFREILERYSLRKEYEEWEEQFGQGPTMPLPLWWFDFSYNVLKRVRRNQLKKNPKSCKTPEDLFFYTKRFYECMGEQLKQQQDFYASCELNLSDVFRNCPAIKCILNDERGGDNSYTDGKALLTELYSKMINLTAEEPGRENG